ncbi:MAG: hypothetical protein NVS1B6_03140 [Steroidobacteraceae bacterium]
MPNALAKDRDAINTHYTVESLRDHLLGLLFSHEERYQERHDSLVRLIEANDARYRAVEVAEQRAVDLAFVAQQSNITLALAAQKEFAGAAMHAAQEAVNKAEAASERRFAGVNEFRAQLGDQQRTLMPRAEVEVLVAGLTDKIAIAQSDLRKFMEVTATTLARSDGSKSGVHAGWGWAVGAIGLMTTILTLFTAFKK